MIREYIAKRRYVHKIAKSTTVEKLGTFTFIGPRKDFEMYQALAKAASDSMMTVAPDALHPTQRPGPHARVGEGNAITFQQAMANDPYGFTADDYRALRKAGLIERICRSEYFTN